MTPDDFLDLLIPPSPAESAMIEQLLADYSPVVPTAAHTTVEWKENSVPLPRPLKTTSGVPIVGRLPATDSSAVPNRPIRFVFTDGRRRSTRHHRRPGRYRS